MKWYDWQIDMAKLSSQFPDVLFTVYRAGEESGDLEKGYFLGGKMQTTRASLRYDKFDPAKLR